MISLKTIAQEICACTLCPLANSRTRAVPGEGPDSARIMFVGEAPGREEDVQGRPFVGRSGRVLNQALLEAGIERTAVFITSVVKCRPPHNRVPARREIDSCVSAHLNRQIQSLNPEIICLLGVTALNALLGMDRLGPARGRLIPRERKYLATYHPAGAARNHTWHQMFRADIKKLERLLNDH